MPDYQSAKIYKIEPTVDHIDNEIYIGSTLKPLQDRFKLHIGCYNMYLKQDKKLAKIRSFELFDKYGISNCEISLLEEYPCESKNELLLQEGYYIRTLPNINHNVPGQTLKEYYQKKKADIQMYYQENKQKKIEYQKQYIKKNKLRIQEYSKQYRLLKKKANVLIQMA